jgi:hypothetical protein
MPTVQAFGSWKTGGPAVDSSSLTANRRKKAEYLDYLNAQANNISGPPVIASYGPAATWTGPVPFGSTALTMGMAGGGPSRKSFNLRVVLANSNKDRKTFCNACNDLTLASTR